MNCKKIVKKIKFVIFILFVSLIVTFVSLGVSYSTFIYKIGGNRAVELYISKLDYDIYINDLNTKNISISPGNNILDVMICSNNNIDTYYKLLYLKNNNFSIFYMDVEPFGYISTNKYVNIKLLVQNSSDKNIDLEFAVSGGYNTNSLDDVIIINGYEEIKNKITI